MIETVEGMVAEEISVTAHVFLDHPSEPCLLIHENNAWSFSTAGEAEELLENLMDGDAVRQVIPVSTLLKEFIAFQGAVEWLHARRPIGAL